MSFATCTGIECVGGNGPIGQAFVANLNSVVSTPEHAVLDLPSKQHSVGVDLAPAR